MAGADNLVSLIEAEIQRHGPISFARFMELALYAPGLGYYERHREIGRRGDFFTSVSTGSLFGEMLAYQFAEWLGQVEADSPVQIVEAGAHEGVLARDILEWSRQRRPDLFVRLEYWLVEPSPARRAWQEETLRDFASNIKWTRDIGAVRGDPAFRIIFSNELLDAMPVHRFAWNAATRRWEECRVDARNGAFVWAPAEPPPKLMAGLPQIAPEMAAVLPDGFIVEHSPAALAWWERAALTLGRGKLLTIDYGFTPGDLLRPERPNGTLRTYSKHHSSGHLLEHPGECDITAHVNFPALEAAGRAAGLATEGLLPQEIFLTRIVALTAADPRGFEEWTPERRRQFQTLAHPEHLGHAFQILIQARF